MHQESYEAVSRFALERVTPNDSVADVGAYDVNGTFRSIFINCKYTGLDIEPGPNVDLVVAPYDFGNKQFDVVVSGSAMEHVQDLRRWAAACIAIMRPGGLLCVVVPHGTSGFTEHRHPVDCWRVWPDGIRWLFRDLDIFYCAVEARDTVMYARRKIDDLRSSEDILRNA